MTHISETDTVWYFAYGSNTNPERFMHYIRGGRPEGAQRHYEGCRDQAAPLRIEPYFLLGKLKFAGRSTVWGGGMAFLDTSAVFNEKTEYNTVRGTRYLITHGQFEDIYAQENHTASFPLDWDALREGQAPDSGISSIYGNALYTPAKPYDKIQAIRGPANEAFVTITASEIPEETKPAPKYLDHIARGISQIHELGRAAAYGYLESMLQTD